MKRMAEACLSSYDVAKALDSLKFESVYDVLEKVMTSPIGKAKQGVLGSVAKRPGFQSNIREYERAVRQIEQILPLIERGRPRRGVHQESVAQVLMKSVPGIYGRGVLRGQPELQAQTDPQTQVRLIKDINFRLNEIMSEVKVLESKGTKEALSRLEEIGVPERIRTVSTLGLPESASEVVSLRPGVGMAKEGTEYLRTLQADTLKMYTENLRELAPFGTEFQNVGRNISNVTNALSSGEDDINDAFKRFGVDLGKVTTDFPSLRTERERGMIAGGRYGAGGYGFNVLAELRSTANTFEDQVLISGRLADALTSITKKLILPSKGGRVEGAPRAGISEVEPKLLRDVEQSVMDAAAEIQNVLGVSKEYKGRADKALISDVTKAISVVRSADVEVQAARLAEVFMNYFGRKVTTRYGAKGVGVTPTLPRGARDVLQYYEEDKKFKVLAPEEAQKAGLGTAIMPKTLGELASELIEEKSKGLTKYSGLVSNRNLQKNLLESGNKFMLSMFKDVDKGVVVADEAIQQQKLFKRVVDKMKELYGTDLSDDIEGVKQLKDLYKKELGKQAELYKEMPIDVQISSYGVGKRGLQTEVLESVLANIAGVGAKEFRGKEISGATTLKTKFGEDIYRSLLGKKGEKGKLSEYAAVLGYESAFTGTDEDIRKAKNIVEERFGKKALELEELSNYYVDVLERTLTKEGPGVKKRKGLVGTKFLQVIEEPHLYADWSKREIEKGIKGEKLNIPAYAAYASIFGEKAPIMEEIRSAPGGADVREHLEYIKALQSMNEQAGEFRKRLFETVPTKELSSIAEFDQTVGAFEDLQDTLLDMSAHPEAFKVMIPSVADPTKKEPLYVPGAAARGKYEEEIIGGEYGPTIPTRRLMNVISSAKKVEEIGRGMSEIVKEVEDLEMAISRLDDSQDEFVKAGLEKRLEELNTILEESYGGTSMEKLREDIASAVKGMVGRANALKREGGDVREVIGIVEKLKPFLSVEKGTMPPGYRTTGLTPAAEYSQVEHIEAFLGQQLKVKSQVEAHADVVGRIADVLIGSGKESRKELDEMKEAEKFIKRGEYDQDVVEKFASRQGLDKRSEEFANRLRKHIKRSEDKFKKATPLIESFSRKQLYELVKEADLDTVATQENAFERALAQFARAKVDYYETIAEKVLGKSGSIAQVLFSRKIPAVMGKAITASVDKTEDLKKFSESLKDIYGGFEDLDEELGLQDLLDVSKKISDINEEHAKNVKKYKKMGLPVLKQTELGIPKEFAEKIPVTYTEKYRRDKEEFNVLGGETFRVPKTVRKKAVTKEGSLYDMLKYMDDIVRSSLSKETDPAIRDEVKKHVKEDLVPYIETVRYPFTGISSVQPFEPKLIGGKKGAKDFGKYSIAVPGIPELDLEAFDKEIERARSVVEKLSERREALGDTEEGAAKREKLNNLIDELNTAISNVLPKYLSHEQKLDFDGDAIEVHAAKTAEARKNIEQHFNSLAEDIDSTRAVFRDVFTYGAAKSMSKARGEFPLAEMSAAFEKKFASEKGYEFLKKPFFTEKLEYLKPGEQLEILAGEGGDVQGELENIVRSVVKGDEDEKKFLEVINASIDKTASGLMD
jgi:hypothetical protein